MPRKKENKNEKGEMKNNGKMKNVKHKKKAARKPKKVKLKVRIKKPKLEKQESGKTRKQLSSEFLAKRGEGKKFKENIKKLENVQKVEKVIEHTTTNSVQYKKKSILVNKQVDSKKIERDKRLIMWSGVVFFMILIFGIWLFNIKNIFKTASVNNSNQSVTQEWDKIIDDFNKTFKKVEQEMAELKKAETTEADNDIFIQFNQDELDELKVRLEELENKNKTEKDGQQATSTATSTPNM